MIEIPDSSKKEYRADFEAYEVMWIRITGKERPEAKTAKLPMTRDDGNLVSEMYDFMSKEKITPLFTMSSGGGCYHGLFTIPDGEKLVRWLHDHGGLQFGCYSSGG
jgi:hypothetical protein